MSEANGRILEVGGLDCVFEPRRWAFAEERAGEIAAHWAERKAALPSLFDGRVLLAGRHELAKGGDGATTLRASYFDVDFKSFLAWRDFGFPDASVCNCFSMAALQSSDSAFLLGEMAAHTANAGAVYFAAGTPDLSDVFGDRVDLAASVRRELLEETGISPDEVAMAPGWTIVLAPPRVACMKIMRMGARALEIQQRVEAFLAAESNPELARMHIVRRRQDIAGIHCPAFVADFLRHALEGG